MPTFRCIFPSEPNDGADGAFDGVELVYELHAPDIYTRNEWLAD